MSAIARDPPRLDFDLVREAFDRTSVGLVVITPEGVFRQVNKAFCDITGYSREELEGQSFRMFTHPDDIARDDEQSHDPWGGDGLRWKRFIRKGRWRGVGAARAAAMRDPEQPGALHRGRVRRPHRAAPEGSRASPDQRVLKAIVENTPVAIYTTDLDGVINFWNPAAERVFGFTPEQAIGKLAPFVPAGKKQEAEDLHARVLKGEILNGLELERQRADGSPITIHGAAAPLRDEDDLITGQLVACVDVTDAKRAVGDLESHLHFTRALLDAIPSPVYFKDREGRYQVRNRAWEELFGGGREWSGKTVGDMYPADIAAQHEERDRALLERPSATTYEIVMPTGDGERREMLLQVSFVDQGGVAGLIGIITDVTRAHREADARWGRARFRVLTETDRPDHGDR
jgi:PAS domain S-box-containing protein